MEGDPLFLITMEVDVPSGTEESTVDEHLERLKTTYGFDIQAHPLETFLL